MRIQAGVTLRCESQDQCMQAIGHAELGPVYTKRQHLCLDNSPIESLQKGIVTHFQASPLISMRTVSLASSQSCCSVDVGAWCKGALRELISTRQTSPNIQNSGTEITHYEETLRFSDCTLMETL